MTNGSLEESGESVRAAAFTLAARFGAGGLLGTEVCASEAAGTLSTHSRMARNRVIFSPRRRQARGKCRLDAIDGKARMGTELRGWQRGRGAARKRANRHCGTRTITISANRLVIGLFLLEIG